LDVQSAHVCLPLWFVLHQDHLKLIGFQEHTSCGLEHVLECVLINIRHVEVLQLRVDLSEQLLQCRHADLLDGSLHGHENQIDQLILLELKAHSLNETIVVNQLWLTRDGEPLSDLPQQVCVNGLLEADALKPGDKVLLRNDSTDLAQVRTGTEHLHLGAPQHALDVLDGESLVL
jgi:hypothetical protein